MVWAVFRLCYLMIIPISLSISGTSYSIVITPSSTAYVDCMRLLTNALPRFSTYPSLANETRSDAKGISVRKSTRHDKSCSIMEPAKGEGSFNPGLSSR